MREVSLDKAIAEDGPCNLWWDIQPVIVAQIRGATNMRMVATLALSLSVGGCINSSNITPEDGQTFQVQGHTYDQVWNAG